MVGGHMRNVYMVVCRTLELCLDVCDTHDTGHYIVADAIYVLLTRTSVSYTGAMVG